MVNNRQHLLHVGALLYFFFGTTATSFRSKQVPSVPEVYEVVVGSKVTFHCTLNADHSLYRNIEWMAEKKRINFNNQSRFFETHNHSLVVTDTKASDSGLYTCLASNDDTEDIANATASFKLVVQDKPSPPKISDITCHDGHAMILWRPNDDDGRSPLLHYSLEYNTSSNPDVWSVASNIIPSSAKRYTVWQLTPWENYTFRVMATNKIGQSNPSSLSKVCSVEPEVPYKNPENVTVSPGDHSCDLVISWTPMRQAELNGPGFAYRVYWKKNVTEERWNSEVITDYTRNELVVMDQPKYQGYVAKVVASNKVGDSKANQTEVFGYLGAYDKDKNGVIYTLKWLFIIFIATFFFFIFLFIISPIFVLITPRKRTPKYSEYPFWVSSVGAVPKPGPNEQHSATGSVFSMSELHGEKPVEIYEEVVNDDDSFCDLMQVNPAE